MREALLRQSLLIFKTKSVKAKPFNENFKIYFSYEYINKQKHLEADNSAYCVDSYGYSNYSWRYELHVVD